MGKEYSAQESVKKHIQIFFKTTDGKSEMEHFDYNRNDKYTTEIDAGYENLVLPDDAMKVELYMKCDIIRFNNGRKYKVIHREFQPCIPVMLYIYVEEILE